MSSYSKESYLRRSYSIYFNCGDTGRHLGCPPDLGRHPLGGHPSCHLIVKNLTCEEAIIYILIVGMREDTLAVLPTWEDTLAVLPPWEDTLRVIL